MAVLVRPPPVIVVTLAVPSVRFADPPDTVKFARVTSERNEPPVTFDKPVTFPPVRLVVPLVVVSAFSEPPVRFKVPAVVVAPLTVPPVISTVPPVVTFKLLRITFDVNVPPVTFDRPVTFPPVKVAVPLDTSVVRDPPVRLRLPAEIVVPVTLPPSISAVAPDPTIRVPSVEFVVKFPPVTFDTPVTVTPVNSVTLLETIEPNVPPVALNVPEVLAEPMLPAEISAVPEALSLRLPRFTPESSNPPITYA